MSKKSKKDKVFLQIPKILVTSNVYDNLLLVAQEISLGLTTMKDYLKSQGYNEEQINNILENKKDIIEKTMIEDKSQNNLNNNKEAEKLIKDNDNNNSKIDNSTKTGVDNRLKKK